jgi:hypothetical protein
MIDEQLKGKKGEYTVQVYEISEGELSISVWYKDPSSPRGHAAHFYTGFKEREPKPKPNYNGNFDGNYGGE